MINYKLNKSTFSIARVIIVLLIIEIIILTIIYSYSKVKEIIILQNRQKNGFIIKSNAHLIHIAIEKFAHQNGFYPLDINMIKDKGFINEWPVNPYSHSSLPMKNVDFKLNDLDLEGNFTYIPVIKNNNVIGFYLLVHSDNYRNYYLDYDSLKIFDMDNLDADKDGYNDFSVGLSKNTIVDIDKNGQPDNLIIIIRGFKNINEFETLPKISYLLRDTK